MVSTGDGVKCTGTGFGSFGFGSSWYPRSSRYRGRMIGGVMVVLVGSGGGDGGGGAFNEEGEESISIISTIATFVIMGRVGEHVINCSGDSSTRRADSFFIAVGNGDQLATKSFVYCFH